MLLSLHRLALPSLASVIAVFDDEIPEKILLGKTLEQHLNSLLESKTCTGEKGQTLTSYLNHGQGKTRKIIIFGLGKKKEWTPTQARNLGAQLIKAGRGLEEKSVSILLPVTVLEHLQAFAEGLHLGNDDLGKFKTGEGRDKRNKHLIHEVQLVVKHWTQEHEAAIARAQDITKVVLEVRSIVNAGPNMITSDFLVNEFYKTAKANRYRFTDFKKRHLEKMGMGAILAVNQGSADPARLVVIEHVGTNKNEPPIVLAGKGIIFDTGGLNLKPGISGSLHEMQLDMAGAAVVLGVFQLLKKLNIDRHVIGIVPITDNAVGHLSCHPSDIITTYDGTTVEILNTDGEGRLILCDALAYARKQYKPQYLIDIATLTGACVAALGFRIAGLFGNDQKLLDDLMASGKRTDEILCQLPITETDEKSMKGKLADLRNAALDQPNPGASRAAAFLKHFVGDTKWAHLDIAGTAFTKEPKDYECMMGTGYGVRLLIDFLEHLADE